MNEAIIATNDPEQTNTLVYKRQIKCSFQTPKAQATSIAIFTKLEKQHFVMFHKSGICN